MYNNPPESVKNSKAKYIIYDIILTITNQEVTSMVGFEKSTARSI